MRPRETSSWSGSISGRATEPPFRIWAVKLTPSLGLINTAAGLRLDSMALRTIWSWLQSVLRYLRTGHWHRNLKVLRISLWRLARQRPGLLLAALRYR